MNAPLSALIAAWVDGSLQPVDKLEVHRRGLRHPAVSVFVLSGTRVLVQQRALGKYHTPGLWTNTCCTHPHWGEDPAACAVRRLREELGITGLTVAAAGQVEYRAEVGQGLIEHEVVDVFTAEAGPDLAVVPNPAEVAGIAWIDLYDLAARVARDPARFTPWLAVYLSEHMDRIFGPLGLALQPQR